VLPEKEFTENQCLGIDLTLPSIVLCPDEKLCLYILSLSIVGSGLRQVSSPDSGCFNLQMQILPLQHNLFKKKLCF